MNELEPMLTRWANFYVSMAQAGAALIGLLFVVITIATDRRSNDIAKIRVYLTPTVIYFATVLGISELLTIPSHTRLTAALCICLVGVVGFAYSGSLFVRRGGRMSYYEKHDLIPHAVLPFASFGLLVLGGASLLHGPEHGIAFVAAGILSLLLIGIRNSWAIVVDVVSTRPGGP